MRTWHDPERYDPTAARCARSCSRRCTAASVDLLRAENARAAPARSARRSAAPTVDDDLEREVLDLAEAEAVRSALADARPTANARAIELAYFGGHTYQRGRGAARATRRHREEPDPIRAAAPAGRAHRGGGAPSDDADPSRDPELDALLGAYALDALEADERALVDAVPRATTPRARAEVDELRETRGGARAARRSATRPRRAELWERIAGAIGRRRPRRATSSRPRRRADVASRRGVWIASARGRGGRDRGRRCSRRRSISLNDRLDDAQPTGDSDRGRVRPRRRQPTARARATLDRRPARRWRASCCCPTAPATSSTTT